MNDSNFCRLMSIIWGVVALMLLFIVDDVPYNKIYGVVSISIAVQYNIAAMKFK